MAIYIFDQTIKCLGDSIDDIKRYKEQMLEKTSAPIKCIFTKLPEQKDIRKYGKAGISEEHLISMHQYFTDNHVLKCSVKTEEKLEELKNDLHYTNVNRMDTEIRLGKNGYVIASIILDGRDGTYCREICYFSYMKLLRREIYTNGVAYVDYYMTAESEGGLYAKRTRRTFYNMDSSVAYTLIFEGGKDIFLFKDGNVYTKQQFAAEFVKKLNLSKQDIIVLDSSVPEEFLQAIFTFGKAARVVTLVHAGLERLQGGNVESSFLKGNYYEWFPYSELIDTMVVSTKEQKCVLRKELEVCSCSVPDIKVTPIDGVFVLVTLYESYGENLALSWNYKGNSDGFLIYDENGTQIYETNNTHQHYFLLEDYEKEKSFIVKAFAYTLKGKSVIAESEPIYLSARQYEKPVVSLVIPAYNTEDYIVRTIDNALAQSFSDLEIIVVDDGSVDNTARIIDWYAEKYPNVVVIHKENEGVAVARNTGIRVANGEYIEFMDSDDMIRPDMVERFYHSIVMNNCDIAVTSAYTVNGTEYVGYLRYGLKEDVSMLVEEFFPAYNGNELGVVVWNKLYSASLIKQHMFPVFPYEDTAWTPYILSYANTICYIDGYFYEWKRENRNTLSNRLASNAKNEVFERLKKAVLFYVQNGNPQRRKILKESAKATLLRWERIYADENYGKLWEWIDENFEI